MAEKPIECNHCQKAADVIYKVIADENTSCTKMCSECPILDKKLYGQSDKGSKGTSSDEASRPCCAFCMTTTESIRAGEPLGCNLCYDIFEDLLIDKLMNEHKLPPLIQKEIKNNKGATLHRGKSPSQSISIPLSNQIVTLNAALNDALQKEHYEHAAWLRDQIKELKETGQ